MQVHPLEDIMWSHSYNSAQENELKSAQVWSDCHYKSSNRDLENISVQMKGSFVLGKELYKEGLHSGKGYLTLFRRIKYSRLFET